MTTINHWGKWIDSEIPVTGVHSINNIDWNAYDFNKEICLDCGAAQKEWEINNNIDDEDCDYQSGPEDFEIECDSSHTKLFGDWLQDEMSKYYPDPAGEFAAIMNESTIQVVFSKTVGRHNICSPCYPGQVDNDSSGQYLGYELPVDMLYEYSMHT